MFYVVEKNFNFTRMHCVRKALRKEPGLFMTGICDCLRCVAPVDWRVFFSNSCSKAAMLSDKVRSVADVSRKYPIASIHFLKMDILPSLINITVNRGPS